MHKVMSGRSLEAIQLVKQHQEPLALQLPLRLALQRQKKQIFMPRIFGDDYLEQHIGSSIKYRQRLHKLEEVEDYFIELCKRNNIEQSIDCTANESTYYKTLNCTTYAGMFIVHPLCFSSTVFQMYDAKADNMVPGRHLGWIKSNLKKGQGTKYVQGNNNEFNEDFDKDFTHVAVLPGSNKIYEHVESKKLQSLINSL